MITTTITVIAIRTDTITIMAIRMIIMATITATATVRSIRTDRHPWTMER